MTGQLAEPEYPQLRNAADQASRAAQQKFLWFNAAQLILLVISAFISGLGFKSPEHQRPVGWVLFALMLLALVFATIQRIGKFDDRWFRCRAYAENFKSLVWHYVMSASSADSTAEQNFLNSISELNRRLPELQKAFARYGIQGKLITEWMRKARTFPVEQKLTIYNTLRIDDQTEWYSDRAKINSTKESRWFWSVIVVEFVAVASAALQANELLQLNPVSGIAAIGTALIAWSQIKRFSDLATSYAIAAGDLCRIAESHRRIESQEELDMLVEEIETAVSREHSMWLARRSLT